MKDNPRFKKRRFIKRRVCEFCNFSINHISFRNTNILNKLTSFQGRILPSKVLGTCAKHQRMIAQSIKQARYMAIIPYVKPRIRQQKRFIVESKNQAEVEQIPGESANVAEPIQEVSNQEPKTLIQNSVVE